MKISIVILTLFSALSFGQRTNFSGYDFTKADSIAKTLKGQELNNLPNLVYRLTNPLETEVEKFRAIYTWICNNIENDYNAYVRTVKKRKKFANDQEAFHRWNSDNSSTVIKKLLKDKKTACTGYAYLVREMATLADIDCKIIDGFGRTATLNLNEKSVPNHSWNAVQLDGQWYLCDATWSAGQIYFEKNVPVFKNEYHDGYFLAEPSLFIKNHFPLEADWTLLSEPPTFKQFINGPVVYKEAFPLNIIPIKPSAMKFEAKKNEPVTFILEVPKNFKSESISMAVNSGTVNKTVQSKVTLNQNDCLLEYSFNLPGTYDVHIQIDDTIIATYVVKVKRR